jgi:hypothetical protein
MLELGDMSEVCKEGKNISVQNKRRSLQDSDFSEYAASPRKTTGICKVAEDIKRRVLSEKDVNEMEDDEDFDDEGVDAGTDSSLEEGHLGYQVNVILYHNMNTFDESLNTHYNYHHYQFVYGSVCLSICFCFLAII